MTRRQRRAHALIWPVLALALAALTGVALYERQRTVAAIAATSIVEPR